jgi:non-specific serine/threonine protein kinase
MDRHRTGELAMVVLQDLALAFELLRQANGAQARAVLPADAPVLSVRRAIALLGMDGVQQVAQGLRPWPGASSADDAHELSRAIAHAVRAAELAAALRPAAYDAEVARLVALLQNLGRLLCRYHFPDESRQVDRLVRSGEADVDAAPDAGVDESDAACAVLGVDFDALGAAVARHWGFDEATLAMLRRLPGDLPPRKPHTDEALLRATASCANEAVDAAAAGDPVALERVARRYARVLPIDARELRLALGLPAARQGANEHREAGAGAR